MSFGFSPGMGPRGAIRNFGNEAGEGALFNREVVGGMLRFVRPYRRRMGVALLLMLIVTLLTLLIPYLIKVTIDDYITAQNVSGLGGIIGVLTGAYVALYITSGYQQYLLGWVSQRVLTDMRHQLVAHLQRLSLSFHDRTIVGVTVSRVINDVAVINDLLTQALITLAGDLLVLVGIVVIMLSLSWRLALLTFVVLPLMALVTWLFSLAAKDAFRLTRRSVADLVGSLAETIDGVRVIQAFAQERAVRRRFETVNMANKQANVDAIRLSFIFLPSIEVLATLATAIVIYFGGRLAADETVTIGTLVAFMAYVTRFFRPIQELSRIYTTLQSAMAGGEQVLRLLNTQADVQDAPDAVAMAPIAGRIELRNVSFRYEPQLPLVLHNVDLTIEAGQQVAFVGQTGAGKTTLANLMARFYDASEGVVLIDGIDVRKVQQRSLRRQIGYVPQDPFLFAGTIAANIRYGAADASDEQVVAAARLANADGFIRRLPLGYKTPILERAVNLSQGQRQLLCIARAALVQPRILILDEATASVDTVTELLIQQALARLLHRRTALIIAHRLSTIRQADLICVVSDGQIVERGRHADLLQRDGHYRALYERQFSS